MSAKKQSITSLTHSSTSSKPGAYIEASAGQSFSHEGPEPLSIDKKPSGQSP